MNYEQESARTASSDFNGHLVGLHEVKELFEAAMMITNALDRIKKLCFYGEDANKGRLATQVKDHRNGNIARDMLHASAKGRLTPEECEHVIHGVLGTFTEAGEMVEALYKAIYQAKDFDAVNMREEIGDVQWYIADLCRALNTTINIEQARNIQKLRTRYPHKFTSAEANNRDLQSEREILESK